ncbi:aminotransferase class I/II-fold pyridoxal phosphate-dependent enzyme [bacterium]|nr:aminotransferase class I/II-fold pyridoxal phosphate-dependent enzyme [bacterium]
MKYKVLYAEANYGKAEIDAAIKVLEEQRHNMVASTNVTEFQEKIAALFGKSYGVMSNSGSSANLLALVAFSFEKGKNVITPALTFSTTVAPIVQCDLVPNFVDCKIDTLQIDEDAIEGKINSETIAIMVPNLIGNLPDWKRIREIANKHNLVVIEDSADTVGYEFDGMVGNPYSDVVTTSFYASHIITGAGVGGMTCFNDLVLRDKALSLRGWGRRSTQYGETEDTSRRLSAKLAGIDYDDKYIFDDLGYNFIPTELSAAFALVQLGNLEKNIQTRLRNYAALSNILSKHSELIRLFSSNNTVRTNWLAFPFVLRGEMAGRRKELQLHLEENGIQTRTIFTGNILRHPALSNVKIIGDVNNFPNSDEVMENGILLGCHSRLSLDQVNYMGEKINMFIEGK